MGDTVFLFVPNILGYLRIILLFIACWFMASNCSVAIICYLISGLLDALDGHAARYLNQSTKFGAMLDMIVDRCATMCLLGCLIYFYPRFMFFFHVSMTIDIASHWLHLHSAILSGSSSHKIIDLKGNPILRLYYTNRIVLFCMCAGNELFYAMLYVSYFHTGQLIIGSLGLWPLLALITFPVAVAKSAISLVQLYAACYNMNSIDMRERQELEETKAKSN